MIYDNLKDVLKHTHSLGILEVAKLSGDENGVTVESLDTDRTVVLYGSLKNPIPELAGKTLGLARMGVLNGYLNFAGFKPDAKGVATIKTTERNGETVPSEISFKSAENHSATYRFMSGDTVEEQIKMPKFKGAEWDIEYSPSKKNLQDLAYFANILGTYEPSFGVHIENGTMSLTIGSSSSDRSLVPFANGIDTKFQASWRWPLGKVLSILKLGDESSKTTMYFSNAGALKIQVDSGLGVYSYVLPASKAS